MKTHPRLALWPLLSQLPERVLLATYSPFVDTQSHPLLREEDLPLRVGPERPPPPPTPRVKAHRGLWLCPGSSRSPGEWRVYLDGHWPQKPDVGWNDWELSPGRVAGPGVLAVLQSPACLHK